MKHQEASKILKVVFEKNIDLDKKSVEKIRTAKKAFIGYYTDNPKEFIETFIKIIHYKTNSEVDFILNRAQKKVIKEYSDSNWLAVPKARQLGITTLTNALALHHSLFVNNAFVACMAVKNSNAEENLGRIRTMFSSMPKWVQSLLLHWNDKEYFSNKSQWTFKSLVHNTTSTVEVASAASEDSTRGKRITFCHWTETAFSDVADKVFTSMSPSLRRRPDSKVIIESTGNGATGFYYDVCTGKKKGFKVVFLPWYEDDDYRSDDLLNEQERILVKDYIDGEIDHLDEKQLAWYYHTALEMGVNSCQQEYPNNVEQVFLSTNKSFFVPNCINKIEHKKPIYYLNYTDGFLSKSHAGPCQVWEAPKNASEYLIAVDASEGIIDPSSITVISPSGEEVAHWHSKYTIDALGDLLVKLARHYNNAWIAVESNGIGNTLIHILKNTHFYQFLHQYEGKVGVRTSQITKPLMLSELQTSILEGKMVFHNTLLPEEMKTFQADTLKAMKGDGIHDDVVISSAIAALMFNVRPPKYKRINNTFRDYDRIVNKEKVKRRFIIGGRNG